MDSNLDLYVRSSGRNRYSLIIRTPGKGDIEYFYTDTGNHGGRWTNSLRGLTIPAAGRGQNNQIIVRVGGSAAGSFRLGPKLVQQYTGTPGSTAVNIESGSPYRAVEKSYIAFYRKGAGLTWR